MHTQPIVDHGHRVAADLAGADDVEGRRARAAGIVEPFVIALHLVARLGLEGDVLGDCRLPHDLAGDLHARHRAIAVGLGRQEVGPDRGLGAWHRRFDMNRSA